jgi:TPR repeat protein
MEMLVLILVPLLYLWADDAYTVFKISAENRTEEKEKIRSSANAAFPLKIVLTIAITFTAFFFYLKHENQEQTEIKDKLARKEIMDKREDEANAPAYAAAAARRKVEEKRIFDIIDEKARKGDPEAEYQLGNLYRDGVGVGQDLTQAVGCWGAAALHGHVRAQTTLGDCFTTGGRGVNRDLVQAAKMYRMAARQGDSIGLQRIAECYLSGQGVVKDEVEAYAYFALISMRKGREDTNPLKRFFGQGTPLETLEGKLSQDQIAAGSRRANELQKEIENY